MNDFCTLLISVYYTKFIPHVAKVVDDLGCSKTFVAQIFNGAAVMTGHMSGLQSLVISRYPSLIQLYSFIYE